MSTPVPEVTLTFTDLGSGALGGTGGISPFSHAQRTCADVRMSRCEAPLRYSVCVLIQDAPKAKTHLFLWTTAFVLGLWGFWTRASWWAEALTAVLTVWAWAGAAASARALKYGFYDI